jgi:hypothetical protein
VSELTEEIMPEKQVKSRQRVTDHGEVFTRQQEVNAMLDLVKQETERIDSRFLEPACGDGNFLAEVIRRKLDVVESRYAKNQVEYERYALLAVSSIYGIDILEDNVIICRNRLFEIFHSRYTLLYKEKISPDLLKSIKFILYRNIIFGDALSLKTCGLIPEPIIFSEWSLAFKNMIKRRDYKMTSLLESKSYDGPNLFSDLGDEAFIPVPVETFPLKNIYNISENVQTEL